MSWPSAVPRKRVITLFGDMAYDHTRGRVGIIGQDTTLSEE